MKLEECRHIIKIDKEKDVLKDRKGVPEVEKCLSFTLLFIQGKRMRAKRKNSETDTSFSIDSSLLLTPFCLLCFSFLLPSSCHLSSLPFLLSRQSPCCLSLASSGDAVFSSLSRDGQRECQVVGRDGGEREMIADGGELICNLLVVSIVFAPSSSFYPFLFPP